MLEEMREIKDLALSYSKEELGRLLQLGLLTPQKAMLAGMMIQRVAAQNAKPPQTTAVQDVLGLPAVPNQPQQPQMPPQGVAAIPAQRAPNPGIEALPAGNVGNYAGGGIVAFDEGGEVPGFAGDEGSFVNYGIPISYGGVAGGEDFFNKPVMPYGEQMRNVGSSLINALRRIVSDPSLDEKDRAAAKAKLEQISPTYPDESRRGSATFTSATSTVPPAALPPIRGTKDKGTGGAGSAGGVKDTGIRPPTIGEFDPNAVKLQGEFYEAPTPKALGEYGKERTDYLKSMGVDPEMYDKMIKGVEEKKGKLEKRKGEAGGEALMMAGLGLIGARRGQEFQALGESGKAALSAYKQDVKDLRAADEKYDERIEALRMADQTAKQTGAEKDIARRDVALQQVEAAKMEKARAQNELAKTGATVAASVYGTKAHAETSRYQVEKSAETQRYVANLQAQTSREYTNALKAQGLADSQIKNIMGTAAEIYKATMTKNPMADETAAWNAALQQASQGYAQVAPMLGRNIPTGTMPAPAKLTGADYEKKYGLSPVK